MLNITIRTIPHDTQRYPTVGDWIIDPESNNITILVSDMGDWKKESLVAIHELTEVLGCISAGIKQEDVDAFDMQYEQTRSFGDTNEPGDDCYAPYFKQHQLASRIEKDMAQALKVNWWEYEKVINDL
jgi:hypothetical protein